MLSIIIACGQGRSAVLDRLAACWEVEGSVLTDTRLVDITISGHKVLECTHPHASVPLGLAATL